jgi:proteic killer suppression protein
MIVSFACRKTERLWQRRGDHGLPLQIERAALRKLTQLDRSRELRDLRVPPGNHLEALKGDRAGQHSIRINDRYRICFCWQDEDAHSVEVVDYH